MAPNENQLQASLNTISTISGIFQAICWRNATHSCYGGLGVSGRLLRSALGRHWGRWEFWGCGCRETTAGCFFFSFSGLLGAPADSSICSVLLSRVGENWLVLRDELPASAIQGQDDVFSFVIGVMQADTHIHVLYFYQSISQTTDLLNMQQLVLHTRHSSFCHL